VAIVVVTGGGCSFVFVKPAKIDGETFNHSCTTNQWAPAVDLVLAGTNTVRALYVATQDDVINKSEAVSVGASAAALQLASSIYGCRAVVGFDGPGRLRRYTTRPSLGGSLSPPNNARIACSSVPAREHPSTPGLR